LVLALVFIKERGLSPASLSSIEGEELTLEELHLLDGLLEGEGDVHKQGGQSSLALEPAGEVSYWRWLTAADLMRREGMLALSRARFTSLTT